MSRSVVVLCPNARRETVKVTPNDSILQVLEEACRKQNINPIDFDIYHFNKPLDLSLPFRFANVPNNAVLELKPAKSERKDCKVTVGLQLESGERIMKDFLPSASISDVVEECLNSRSDVIPKGDVLPVCIYMRQKLIGETLKTTTLRNLGLTTGTAMIRLMYRKPEEFSDQAHVSAPLSKSTLTEQSEDSKQHSLSLEKCSAAKEQMNKSTVLSQEDSFSSEKDTLKKEEKTESEETQLSNFLVKQKENSDISSKQLPTSEVPFKIGEKIYTSPSCNTSDKTFTKPLQPECDNRANLNSANEHDKTVSPVETMEVEYDQDMSSISLEDIKYLGERHAVLYSLEDITDVKKADIPDEFFDLTINDVRYLMEDYKKTRSELENQPLLTKEQRRRKMLQNLSYYKETVIRVYFPDKLVLQAVFKINETVQTLCDFIRNYLEIKNINFYLYITPPRQVLDTSKSLYELMLVPAAVIYFGTESQHNSYLKSSVKEKISDPRAAVLAASESRKASISNEPVVVPCENDESMATNSVEDIPSAVTNSTSHPTVVTSTGKVPKWLKLGRK